MRPINGQRRGGGSSWQSLARGTGSIEADLLNGEIVLLGRLHGVVTPVNELLQVVANELAASGAPPGSMSEDELRARLPR
jgi:2-dehydropantoate 2-reductase